MKHKSKKKTIHKERKQSVHMPDEWLYLVPEELKLRSIYELFKENTLWKAEYWEEAGVLEIVIGESDFMDIECIDADLGDEEGNAYLAKHQIQTVFAVTIVPEAYEKFKVVMLEIVRHFGGFFCGDTKDFKPVVQFLEGE